MSHTNQMDAAAVAAYVAQRFPAAMQSPFAQFAREVTARDEADAAIDFAQLSGKAECAATKRAAYERARSCIESRGGWVEETLSHNIRSNFPDLTDDECDEIAADTLSKARQK
jgi:hypothetical protein